LKLSDIFGVSMIQIPALDCNNWSFSAEK
jgi:hypothetical protein